MAEGHVRLRLGRIVFGGASSSTENECKPGKYTSDLSALMKYVRIGGTNAGHVTRTQISEIQGKNPRTLPFS